MNIRDFSPNNRNKMVERILESKRSKEWNINDYDTKEKAEEKLAELKRIWDERTQGDPDNMPSYWCENVQNHIKELEDLLASGKFEKEAEEEKERQDTVKNVVTESRLPKDNRDPEFGVPEQKKYPLFDREHVISAIKLFGHVEPRFEEKLARAIIAKMRKYDIPFDIIGEDNRLYRYLPKTLKEGLIKKFFSKIKKHFNSHKHRKEISKDDTISLKEEISSQNRVMLDFLRDHNLTYLADALETSEMTVKDLVFRSKKYSNTNLYFIDNILRYWDEDDRLESEVFDIVYIAIPKRDDEVALNAIKRCENVIFDAAVEINELPRFKGDKGSKIKHVLNAINEIFPKYYDRIRNIYKSVKTKETDEILKDIYNQRSELGLLSESYTNIEESIRVKREYDGKTLEVEVDSDVELNDGKKHVIKSGDAELKIKKDGEKLDIEVEVETDVKEQNDRNIEKFDKKLSSDIEAARSAGVPENLPEVFFEALSELSDKSIGAFLAFEKAQSLEKFCKNGEKIDAPISESILITIFYPGTKVHDGACVIKDGVIKYASVFFENVSSDNFAEHYGARHRTAMGLSKDTDAVCIVVSEETGNVSFAVDGKLEVIKNTEVKNSKERFMDMFDRYVNKKDISEDYSDLFSLTERPVYTSSGDEVLDFYGNQINSKKDFDDHVENNWPVRVNGKIEAITPRKSKTPNTAYVSREGKKGGDEKVVFVSKPGRKPSPKNESINYSELFESVLDPIHKTRPVEIFNGDTMRDDAREFILNLVKSFKENSGLEFEIKKVYMIGSSTGFQYSETADIDINIEVDKPSEYFKGKFSLIPKGITLPNTQKPINIFLMFNEEETAHSVKYAENCYDLIENKFIKIGQIEKQEIPLTYVSGLSTFLMNAIDVLFGEFERNKKDLMKIIKLNPNEVQISEKERDDALSKKIADIQTNADSLKMAHHFLFVFNNEGYQDSPFRVRINYKFDDPHYSMNSLVYKYIDSFGYMEKMMAMEREANELIKVAKAEIGRDFNNPTNEVEQKLNIEGEIK